MLREAGGTMTDYSGKPGSIWNGEVVAGNETIQGQLLKAHQGRQIGRRLPPIRPRHRRAPRPLSRHMV